MIKLNHNRPWLQYIDNFRREMNLEAPGIIEGNHQALTVRAETAEAGSRMSHHLQSFQLLSLEQRQVLLDLLEAHAGYMDAVFGHIQSIGGVGKASQRLAAREAAYAVVVAAGVQFLRQLALDYSARTKGVSGWFSQFQKLLPRRERGDWDDLNAILRDESVKEFKRFMRSGDSTLSEKRWCYGLRTNFGLFILWIAQIDRRGL